MRKLVTVLLSVAFAAVLSLSVSAETANLLSDYNKGWSGVGVTYDENHGTINLTEKGSAYREFDVNGADGLYFYCDMGNYSGKGTGNVTLEILGENNEILSSFATDNDQQNGSYRRYTLGSSGYIVIPEEAEKLKVTLKFSEGESSPFFRNFYLDMNSDSVRSELVTTFTVSGDLTLVNNNVSGSQYWIMVVFVFLVALGMFFVRKALDKTKNK